MAHYLLKIARGINAKRPKESEGNNTRYMKDSLLMHWKKTVPRGQYVWLVESHGKIKNELELNLE
ncbi:hypothetical protein LNQ51_16035 [Yersinia ruckeri]|uniref:hypothetical protein n=1 Tax=Yersinia ruckeri TaxID=29486 RepID=UPI0020BEF3D0|nr:hypothetical protein [Yersinia ruckeri]MCK8586360.1 hypothetical protein [Yersinia ruckeri]